MVCPITNTSNKFPLHIPLDNRTKTMGVILTEHMKCLDVISRNIQFVERMPEDLLKKTLAYVKAFFWQRWSENTILNAGNYKAKAGISILLPEILSLSGVRVEVRRLHVCPLTANGPSPSAGSPVDGSVLFKRRFYVLLLLRQREPEFHAFWEVFYTAFPVLHGNDALDNI